MVTSLWTLPSILAAVVSETMISSTGAEVEDMKIASAEEDREAHVCTLLELFNSIDTGGDGSVAPAEVEVFYVTRAMRC